MKERSMSNRIDTAGVYRGKVLEMGVGLTKKSSYPQAIIKVSADEKYIEDAAELAHYEMAEPGWMDYSDFHEEAVGYLVLFNDAEEYSEDTALMNYEQLQLALGWDGTEFDSLNDSTYEGKQVLFRMEEDEYDGKVSLKLNWIDAPDASPNRELRKLDADKVAELSSKLKIRKPKKPVKAAKAKPKQKSEKKAEKKVEQKPKAKAEKKPAAASPPSARKVEETEEAPDEAQDEELSQMDAWQRVVDNKGDNTDSAVEEAWITAAQEIGNGRDEEDLTEKDWAAIAQKVIHDLALDV
jgi:hypothetical protein